MAKQLPVGNFLHSAAILAGHLSWQEFLLAIGWQRKTTVETLRKRDLDD
jgi:hypothetical protein